MSKELKIVVAIFGSLFALAIVAIVALAFALPHIAKNVLASARDPVAAKRTAEKIATFTIPEGYKIQSAEDLSVTQLVTIVPTDGGPHAFQMQLRGAVVPSSGNTADAMKMGMSMMNVFVKCDLQDGGVDPVVVRGVQVKLSVMRCANPKFPMRIEMGDFPGNANQATITAMGLDGSDFDTKALHELLTSVR
jgi:hypothetical protein